jgi:hypothetical protein
MTSAEAPLTRQEPYFIPNEDKLKEQEQKLRDRLELLIKLFITHGISKILAYSWCLDFIKESRDKIVSYVNEESKKQKLEEIELTNKYDIILTEIGTSFKKTLDMIEADTFKAEKLTLILELMSAYVIYKALSVSTLELAKINKITAVQWVIVDDEKTCLQCRENEGLHGIEDCPECPAHVGCRCVIILPGGQ